MKRPSKPMQEIRCCKRPHVISRRATLTWLAAQLVWGRAAAAATAGDVVPPTSPSVEGRVAHALKADQFVVADDIAVMERDGIVTLRGSVLAPLWRERAATVAAAVRDVRAVLNMIRVTPVHRDDTEIAREVRKTLHAANGLRHLRLGVRVEHGVVELTGHITSYEEQRFAGRLVGGVPGVRFCQNGLSYARSLARTSALIGGDVESRLQWDPWLGRHSLRVGVKGQVVQLEGRVANAFERQRALISAWVHGVTAVEERELYDDDTRRSAVLRASLPTDSEIAEAFQAVLAALDEPAPTGVSASSVSRVLTLRGSVPTMVEQQRLLRLARSVVGVSQVKDELRGPWWRAPVPPTRRRSAARRG